MLSLVQVITSQQIEHKPLPGTSMTYFMDAYTPYQALMS